MAAEQTEYLVLAARHATANLALLSALRGHQIAPRPQAWSREGAFMLLTLVPPESDEDCEPQRWDQPPVSPSPADAWAEPDDTSAQNSQQATAGYGPIAEAGCLLYLWVAAAGWQADDTAWFNRLRSADVPILPVALIAAPQGREAMIQAALDHCCDQVGVRPVSIALLTQESHPLAADLLGLLDRILHFCPRLAIPLAREIPGYRPRVINREVRATMLLAGLLGAGPLPLIDLPLLVAIQWKLMLRIAAVYGRPRVHIRSWEMGGALAMGLALRTVAQQSVKFTPLFGWLLSGLISALSTWLLGQAVVRYYEERPLFAWQVGRTSLLQSWRARVSRWHARVRRQSVRLWQFVYRPRAGYYTNDKKARATRGQPQRQLSDGKRSEP